MTHEELQDWLRLAMTPRVGNGTARRLLAAFGLPHHVFCADPSALRDIATSAQIQALRSPPADLARQLETTAQWLAADSNCRRVLTLADTDYPPALLQTDDPPLMLYVMGLAAAQGRLHWPDSLAIVGSRNPTAQGALNARQFAASFAGAGWTVVSGMALGIDAAAHEGAMEGAMGGAIEGSAPPSAAIATIAVVGTGLDRVYPRQHRALARQIAERGLIASEYLLGTPPLADHFPRRNRILSGLARGTLVVEAALQSGSLVTARFAAEQGREVFAIPGSIHSPQSRGCHALIRQGAKLVETAQDVLEELHPAGFASGQAGNTAPRGTGPQPTHARQEDPLLAALGFEPATLDTMSARTGVPTPELQARLLELELRGQVARLPGGLFQRVACA